jgi:hypothetical protein
VSVRPYRRPLPAELAVRHVWLPDAGHSVLAVRAEHCDPDPTAGMLIPMPVRTVLRHGWQVIDGFLVVAGVEYDPMLGLITPTADDEW